ncbi:hypothetical protein THAOC_25790 [Thalassiosira oceanica]|uniref:DUF4126 domain-containing protein n=1 Tax=Thalassiosira oceanica TaxID=159749 RepID=K0S6T9_THAOC|nr:hypothetical protein THAOC_25790 [Thalassiosira oceanica]|eukprot:EJK54572.1 hypothetical protein THAOC_25790 [Thalassiosira oceanica]
MDDVVVSTVANAAFALTLNGNAGLSPFLCMLLLGIASRASPDDLPLGDTMAEVLGSIPALGFWAAMTIFEYVGKCVPVLDQVVDSIEVFVVPVLSALGSLAAFGSFDHGDGSAGDNGGNNDGGDERRRGRRLGATSGVAVFFRVVLVLFGSMLALSMHFFKMLMRLVGEGCLTCCITVLEASIVCTTVLASIFVRQFAIVTCFAFLSAALFNAKRRHERRKEKLAKEAAVERTTRWRSVDGDDGEEAEECDRKKSPAKKASEKVGDFFGKINARHSEENQEEEATGAYVEMGKTAGRANMK